MPVTTPETITALNADFRAAQASMEEWYFKPLREAQAANNPPK